MRVNNYEILKFYNYNIYFLKDAFLILILTVFALISFMLDPSYSMVFTTSDFLPDIKVGDDPINLAVNSETNTIYVANSGSGTVSVIDGKTNNVSSTVEVGVFPEDLAVNPETNTVYVANRFDDIVSVIDGETNKETTIQLENFSFPRGVAVNPETNTVYVANSNNDTVSVIDGKTNNVSSTVEVGDEPADLAVNPETNTVYVANSNNDTVSVIDGKTNNVSSTVEVGNSPGSVAVNPDTNTIYLLCYHFTRLCAINGDDNSITILYNSNYINASDLTINRQNNTIYVANSGSGTVSVVNGTTNKVLYTVKIGNLPASVDVNPKTNIIYVTDTFSNTVAVVNSSHLLPVIDKNSINKFESGVNTDKSPVDVAVNPETNTVYVANSGSGTVSVVNGSNNRIITTVKIYKEANGVDVNPDTNTVYVTSLDSNKVAVINGTTNKTSSIVNVGDGPRSVAVNPKTNTIYVANLHSNTLGLIDARSNKILLPSKVTLNVSPPNAGKLNCGYGNLLEPDEIVTNQPIRLLLESYCIAEANQGFKFSNWVENLGLNSTKTITSSSNVENPMEYFFNVLGLKSSDSASNFTVTHGGSYTANFKDIPSPIPKEYLIGLYGIVATTIIGLAIPSIVAWIKSKGEIRRLNQYHKKINLLYVDGKLDENDIEAMDILRNSISNAYAKGKINAEHYSNLKDEISILYHELFNKRIGSLDNLSNKEKEISMNQIKEYISDAYAKGKINELHYDLLKDNISKNSEYKE